MSNVIERIEKGLSHMQITRLHPNKPAYIRKAGEEQELLRLAKVGQEMLNTFGPNEVCPLATMGIEADLDFCRDECLINKACSLILNMPLPPNPKEAE